MKHQIDWSKPPKAESPPNFDDLLAVLRHQVPSRPTLFEFGFNSCKLKENSTQIYADPRFREDRLRNADKR